jgi:hypothetical protein
LPIPQQDLTGAPQTFTVPAGAVSVTAFVKGGDGGMARFQRCRNDMLVDGDADRANVFGEQHRGNDLVTGLWGMGKVVPVKELIGWVVHSGLA